MEEIKKIVESDAENVTGGTAVSHGKCELCGAEDDRAAYEIAITFPGGTTNYLGQKWICRKCIDSSLYEYRQAHYPGKVFSSMIYMRGPLRF